MFQGSLSVLSLSVSLQLVDRSLPSTAANFTFLCDLCRHKHTTPITRPLHRGSSETTSSSMCINRGHTALRTVLNGAASAFVQSTRCLFSQFSELKYKNVVWWIMFTVFSEVLLIMFYQQWQMFMYNVIVYFVQWEEVKTPSLFMSTVWTHLFLCEPSGVSGNIVPPTLRPLPVIQPQLPAVLWLATRDSLVDGLILLADQ